MKNLIQITAATVFAVGLFGSAPPASATAKRADVIAACDRTKGCKVKYAEGGDLIISVGGKDVGYCPAGEKFAHNCYPTRIGGSKLFPSFTPDENKGHDGGGRSGGGEVGGPSG